MSVQRGAATIASLMLGLALASCSGDGGEMMSLDELGQVTCGEEWAETPDAVDWYAAGEGGCEGVTVNTFDNPEARDQWADLAVQGGNSPFLEGKNWIVLADQPRLEELQSELGGEIVGGFDN